MDIECTVVLPIQAGDISQQSVGFDLKGTAGNVYLETLSSVHKMAIFTRFSAYKADFNRSFEVLVKIIDEDGLTIKTQSGGEVEISPKHGEKQYTYEDRIYRLWQVEFNRFGVYEISISVDGKEKARQPFEVVQVIR